MHHPQELATAHLDLATENRDLRRRLDLAEQRLLALTPAAEVGVWLWPDVSRDSLYVDASIRGASGLPGDREWFTADEVFGALHPEDGPRVRAAVEAAAAAGGAFELVHRLRPRDGAASGSYVQVNGEAVLRAGRAPLVRGTSRLIDRERSVSRERDRLLVALERIVATGGVQVWEWPAVHEDAVRLNGLLNRRRPSHDGTQGGGDGTRDHQDGTPKGTRAPRTRAPGHPGTPHSAPRTSSWEALVHPDDLAHFRTTVAELRHGTQTFELEVRVSFDGEHHRWQLMHGTSESTAGRSRFPRVPALMSVLSESRPGSGSAGSPAAAASLKACGILVDIEDRKRYQQELERVNEQLRLVTAGTSSGIWDWPDMDADHINLSAELADFMGYAPAEVEDSIAWLFGIIHPDDHAHVDEDVSRVRKTGDKYVSEFRVRTKDGRYRWVRSAGVVTLGAGGPGVDRLTGALSDIHDRVTTERRLAEANRQLRAFADVVAHDLSAPLRHVCAYAGLLREEHGTSLGATGNRYLDHLTRAADQSAHMIAELLEYSRTGTSELRPEEIDLGELCAELRDQLTVGGHATHLTWDIGALPTVTADRTHMLMLFQNLLANAVKFTSGTPAARVEVFAGQGTERECAIVVKDNGVGFDQVHGEHIFEAFARAHTRAEFAGTGIGLANVARIVARHEGRIEAEGEVGKGATFTVWLPRVG